MCVSFQIVSIVTPWYLMFSTLSRTVPSKLKEALIFFDPFPYNLHGIAFDWLESHAPFPCPTAKTIYILLKFRSVLWTFGFAITNTVISKQPYLWVNYCCDIVNIQWEQQWSKNGALRDTRQNGGPIWFYSIYCNSLLPETEKRIYPFQSLSTNTINIQLAFK